MKLDHYIPGRWADPLPLLSRYHPPIPTNVARTYIEACTQPGDLILHPFAHSPEVIRQAAASGRRIIAASANPIAFLTTQGSLTLPSPDDLDTLTTRLADSPKMDQTLRHHLDDLYRTTCPHCGRMVVADYFIWEHDSTTPTEKAYNCPTCGGERREPADKGDRDRLSAVEARGFHYHYLLGRLAGPYDEHRPLAQRLLDLYTPRNLYALASLTMKVETAFSEPRDRRTLSLILLGCLDACTKLNASPWDATHPGRLRPPLRFVELNVWRAFEAVRQQLRPLATSPRATLSSGLEQLMDPSARAKADGLSLVSSRPARSLAAQLPPGSVRLILSNLPPLDPVYYRLSFLWSGWLYGREAAAGIEPLLKRRSHDWSWYETALSRTLESLRSVLHSDGLLVFTGLSRDPAYIEAVLMAAGRAGISAHSIVYQPLAGHPPSELFQGVGGEYQIALSPRPSAQEMRTTDLDALAGAVRRETIAAAESILQARAEPLPFDWLQTEAWKRLSQADLLRQIAARSDEGFQPVPFARQQVKLALQGSLSNSLVGLSHEAGTADDKPRPGHWWLSTPGPDIDPLSDRVERTILEKLTGEVWVTEEMIFQAFPGLLTPARDLVRAGLQAYGVEQPSGVWQLRQGETEDVWQQTSREMVGHLVELGRKLGYRVLLARRWDGTAWSAASTISPKPGTYVPSWVDALWLDNSQPRHAFALQQTGRLGFLLSEGLSGGPDRHQYLVIPEERIELVRLKVMSSPLLRRALAEHRWDFIKFRHLKRLAKAAAIERHHLRVVVGLDPIIEQPEAQIPLF